MLSLLLILIQSSKSTEENLLWPLNPENIGPALEYQPRMLLVFWASSDPSPQKLYAEARIAAQKLNSQLIRIGSVDCSAFQALCSSYSVASTPQLLYVDNGDQFHYPGQVSGEEIAKWVVPRFKYSLDQVKEDEDILSLIKSNRISFIYLGDNIEVFRIMKELSVNFVEIKFYISEHQETRAVLNTDAKFVLHRGDELYFYSGEVEIGKIAEFLEKHKPAIVHEFNEEVIKTVFDKKQPAIFLFSKTHDRKKYLKDFGKLADRYQQRFVFIATDLATKGKNHNKLAHALGLNIDLQPIVVILNQKETFYKYRTAALDFDSLIRFVNDYFENKLLPFYKSQAVDSESVENGVMGLVGINHDEVVNDVEKDVIALYYTAQHPESMSFISSFEKLALNYKDIPDILLVKMDIVYNEAKGLVIPHLPLIKMYTKQNKQGISYSGDLTLFGLQKFVSMHLEKKKSEL